MLRIYTDGACSGNPGPGGWAAVLLYGDKRKEISGFEADTTNNRMEVLAVIRGLEAIKLPCPVEVYSDSAYVVNAVKQNWISNWKRNGWKNSNKQDVKNQDLWVILDELNAKYKPNYIKVKGHAGDPENERCDELARGEIMRGNVS